MTVPTNEFNYEPVIYKSHQFDFWDISGAKNLRHLTTKHFEHANAVVFVIDSADHESLEESKTFLWDLIAAPQLARQPFLILCNKSDQVNSLTLDKVVRMFDLRSIQDRKV